MTIPYVSICIPAYNQVSYLKIAIDSIFEQTYKDYEIIITDDSEDDTVKRLIEKYDFQGRLKYIKNKNRLGTPENWNESIRHANGRFIKILHHDDFFSSSTSLERFVNLLADYPNIDFAFSSSLDLDSNLKVIRNHILSSCQINLIKTDYDNLIYKVIIGSPSVTIFRNTNTILFDKNLKWLVDVDFYNRIFRINNNFNYTSDCLICTVAAKDRVTNICVDNASIELYELLYIINRIAKKRISDIKHLKYLVSKLIYYRVFNPHKLRKLNVTFKLTPIIHIALILAFLYLPIIKLKKKLTSISW